MSSLGHFIGTSAVKIVETKAVKKNKRPFVCGHYKETRLWTWEDVEKLTAIFKIQWIYKGKNRRMMTRVTESLLMVESLQFSHMFIITSRALLISGQRACHGLQGDPSLSAALWSMTLPIYYCASQVIAFEK